MTKQNIEQLLAIREGNRNIIEKKTGSLNVAIVKNDTYFVDLAMSKNKTAMDLVLFFNEKILELTQVDNIASEITETTDYEMNVEKNITLKKEFFSTQTATQSSLVLRNIHFPPLLCSRLPLSQHSSRRRRFPPTHCR